MTKILAPNLNRVARNHEILAFFTILLLSFTSISTALAQENASADEDEVSVPASTPEATSSDDTSSAARSGGPAPLRFSLSAGPMLLTGEQRHVGARIGAAADLYIESSHQYFLNFLVAKPLSGERMEGRYSGIVNRTYFLPGIGMYFTPQQFWGRINIGLGYLTSSHPDVVAKLKPSYSVGLGYKQPINKHLDWGVELAFEYSGRAQKSIAFLYDDLSCALGECDASGTISRATIWSINLLLGYTL